MGGGVYAKAGQEGAKMAGGDDGLRGWFTARGDERDANAARNQQGAVDAAVEGAGRDQAESANDLAGIYARGGSAGEFADTDLVINSNTDALGGESLRNQLMMDAGYNPMSQFNPFVQRYGSLAHAEGQMRDFAGNMADNTMSDWEASQEDLKGAYESSLENLQGERDRKVDAFEEETVELEDKQVETDAQRIVQEWIASEKVAPGTSNDYISRSGALGRRTGANNGAKQRDVDALLADGYSYAEILNGIPGHSTAMAGYIAGNPDTSSLYSQLGFGQEEG